MNNKRLIVVLLSGFVAALIAGLTMGFVGSRVLSNSSYHHSAQLLGAIYSQHPDLEESLVRELKHLDNANIITGTLIMNKYGYTRSVFMEKNRWGIISISLLIWGLLFILFATFLYHWSRKRSARIQGLTTYLYSINQMQERILPPHQEDEFSILEDEMYKTLVELRQSRETALQERQVLADNLADISHQIKTPMTSIFLMTELLSDSRNDSADLIYVEKIHHQMNRLEHLVSTLLTLSRLDAGTLEMKQDPVNVFELLTSAVELLEKAIALKGQRVNLQEGATAIYRGDYYWSVEALLNLIKNCSEHTPTGGTITLSYEQNPIFTKMVVEDDGEGLVKADIPHLFTRFYKGENSSNDSVGIGLALAKSIIVKQGGIIRAENRPEGGARFIIKMYAT